MAKTGKSRKVAGLEVILHLEGILFSRPQRLSTVEHVFFLKANDTSDTRWFHFSIVVQREGWVGPELQSAN